MPNSGRINKIISPCRFLVFTITCVYVALMLLNYNYFSSLRTLQAYWHDQSHQIGKAAIHIDLTNSNYTTASISVRLNDREIESFAAGTPENLKSTSKQEELKKNDFRIVISLQEEKLAKVSKRNCIKEADEVEVSKLNIFFVESTCGITRAEAAITESNGLFLDARQACAIESAAFMNPNHSIYLLYTCSIDDDPYETSTKVVKQVLSYHNVKIVPIIMKEYLEGTPLEELYKSGALEGSKFPVVHVSDVLRLLTLWKYGGTYIDLDTIVMRPIADLGSNYIGLQDRNLPNNAVMNFAHHGFPHDQILTPALMFLNHYFDNSTWSTNGQYLIMDTLLAECNVTTFIGAESDLYERRQIGRKGQEGNLFGRAVGNLPLSLIQGGASFGCVVEDIMIWGGCNGFQIYPKHYFYAVEYFMSAMYFSIDKNSREELNKRLKNSYIAHMWSSESKVYKIIVGSEQPYAKLAQKHCPRIYNSRTTVF